jgi:hypothetical protein
MKISQPAIAANSGRDMDIRPIWVVRYQPALILQASVRGKKEPVAS